MSVTIVDSNANLNVRKYTSFGALPAAAPGVIVLVDDGTTGTFYIGVDVAGVATWVALAVLPITGFIKQEPTNIGDNVIGSTYPSQSSLIVHPGGTAGESVVIEIDNGQGLLIRARQFASSPDIHAVRYNDDQDFTPMLQFDPNTLPSQNPVNGYGEPAAAAFTTAQLVAANAGQLGGLIRYIPPTGAEQLWACLKDASGSPVWAQVFPAIDLPQTLVRTNPTNLEALQQSLDGGTNWADRFVVPTNTAPSPVVAFVPFPALPANATPPVDFWIDCDWSGVSLPWFVPAGYGVQVIDGRGLWEGNIPGDDIFFTDFQGNHNTPNVPPTQYDARFTLGAVIFQAFDANGGAILVDGTHAYNDALAETVSPTGGMYVHLFGNYNIDAKAGTIWLKVRITPTNPTTIASGLQFQVASYLFTDVQYYTPTDTLWVSGVGWQANNVSSHTIFIYKRVLTTNQFTKIKAIVKPGSAFPGGMDFFIGSNLGGSNKLLYSFSSPTVDPATGNYIFESGVGSNPALPAAPFVAGDFLHMHVSGGAGAVPQMELLSFEYSYLEPGDPLQ